MVVFAGHSQVRKKGGLKEEGKNQIIQGKGVILVHFIHLFYLFISLFKGGAASSLAAENNVVKSMNITGLFLMGSGNFFPSNFIHFLSPFLIPFLESPLSLDGMGWIPEVPKMKILHAKNDKVIGVGEMERVANWWGCEFVEMESVTQQLFFFFFFFFSFSFSLFLFSLLFLFFQS